MYIFIKEMEIEKIILEHVVNLKSGEEKAYDILKKGSDHILSRMLLQIKLFLEVNNPMKSVEKLYDYAQDLKEAYEQMILECQKTDFSKVDEQVDEIVEGVVQALKHEISELPEHGDNPIEYERLIIISTILLRIKECAMEIITKRCEQYLVPQNLDENIVHNLESYMNETFLEILDKAKVFIENCGEMLKDLNSRKETVSYFGLIQAQNRLMKSFAEIRLTVANEKVNTESIQLFERAIVEKAKFLISEMNDIEKQFATLIQDETKYQSFVLQNLNGLVETYLFGEPLVKELVALFNEDEENVLGALIVHMQDELKRATEMEMKTIRKMSTKFELLSCVMVEMLEGLLLKLSEVDFSSIEDLEGKKIVEGIMDTLHLKHEVIRDKDGEYHILKKEQLIDEHAKFLEFQNEFEKQSKTFLREAINGSNEHFLLEQEKFMKVANQIQNYHYQLDIQYLKRDLLFEMVTFEEIIQYAIPKLLERNQRIFNEISESIKAVYERMETLIQKNDIEVICPKPHDKFNGKEHEVMMTEKRDDFIKGEIIKTHTKGYKYEESIVIRANVFAAI